MKPCPFCGCEEAEKVHLSVSWHWVYRCQACQATGPEAITPANARLLWDDRAPVEDEP